MIRINEFHLFNITLEFQINVIKTCSEENHWERICEIIICCRQFLLCVFLKESSWRKSNIKKSLNASYNKNPVDVIFMQGHQ